MNRDITAKALLIKYKLYTDDIKRINYHLSILNHNPYHIVSRITRLTDLSEQQLVLALYELILRCDERSPEYDAQLDQEMVRLGLGTDQFYGNRTSYDDSDFEYPSDNGDYFDSYEEDEYEQENVSRGL